MISIHCRFHSNKIVNDSKADSLHINNFKISLLDKQNYIMNEHNKFCEQLKELVEYFLGCSTTIISQIDKQELFKNFLT